MRVRAGIKGHRPTKIFIITTSGPVDSLLATGILWLSVHTWGRWTRWLPQNLVTIAAMVYFVACTAQMWLTDQWRGLGGAFNFAVAGSVCAFLEWRSHQLRGLSGHMRDIDLVTVAHARAVAGIRPICSGFAAFFVGSSFANFNSGQLFSDVAGVAWIWGLYTVTMGRTLPPKKAKRRLHLPSLPKLRLPRLAPTP